MCTTNKIINDIIDETQIIKCSQIFNPSTSSQLLTQKANPSSDRSLSILSHNIRSINKNLDNFLLFSSFIDVQIDVYVFSECWIDESSSLPSITNYTSFHTKKTFNQNDGVAVYVAEYLNYRVYEPDCMVDCNCLVLDLDNKITVISIYRSPSVKNLSCFLNSLEKLLNTIKSSSIILTGDINIDTLVTNTPDSSDYLELLASYGLIQGVTRVTRPLSKTCLDHCLVKCNFSWETAVFEETNITDHSPTLFYCNNINYRHKTRIPKTKIKPNYDAIKIYLEESSWTDYYQSNDVDWCAKYLIDRIQYSLTTYSISVKLPIRLNPLKPWVSIGVIRSLCKRDRIHRSLKKRYSDNLKTLYITYRNWCTKITKTLKKQYYCTQLTKHLSNAKETWKIVKDVGNLNTKKQSASELLTIKENSTTSLDIANNYFTSIGNNLSNLILNKLHVSESDLASSSVTSNTNSPTNSMSLYLTDHLEVAGIVKGLKTGCATGWDEVPNAYFKKFNSILSAPIAHLCNISFTTGVFPDICKKAIVTPIHKSGDPSDPSNYRPISLLTSLSKIIEKLVAKRLTGYLESGKLLATNQFGFRSKVSTEDAVLKLTSKVFKLLDDKQKCLGVFLDLQKAFDTVSIPILLSRLQNIGVRGVALDWFSDYLSNRSQRVRVEDKMSNLASCTFGVPQGSVLGPTLFLVYINDLCKMQLHNGELLMFADDTALIFQGSNWEQVRGCAELGLSKVTSWLEKSLLSLNTSKTKYMCFSINNFAKPDDSFTLPIHTYPCNIKSEASLDCDCPILKRTNTMKYLGVLIDEHLNWEPHLSLTSGRIRKLIFVFKNLRNVANVQLLIKIYKALCESILCYCICVWGGAAQAHFLQLERAQKAVLKVLMSLPMRHPTSLLYDKTKTLSVRKLYIYQLTRRFHRTSATTTLTGRRLQRYIVPFCKTSFAQRSFYFLGPKVYNILQNKINLKLYNNYQIKRPLNNYIFQLSQHDTDRLLLVVT